MDPKPSSKEKVYVLQCLKSLVKIFGPKRILDVYTEYADAKEIKMFLDYLQERLF